MSPKTTSLLHTFLNLFSSIFPHECLLRYQRLLHIDSRSAFKWFSNYILVCAIWFRFFSLAMECSHFLPLTCNSTILFIILYVTGLGKRNEAHGQLKNVLRMNKVLSVYLNSWRKASVKGWSIESPTSIRTLFQHVKIFNIVPKFMDPLFLAASHLHDTI